MADQQDSRAESQTTALESRWRGLRALIVAQFFGAFNDNAWKQFVILLAINRVASESQGQFQTALAQIILLTPFLLFSLPAGVLADRVSKRSVIVAMKVVELVLMLAGTVALWLQPEGGVLPSCLLGLLGLQATLFSPAKYGILPELLAHEQLSAGNGISSSGRTWRTCAASSAEDSSSRGRRASAVVLGWEDSCSRFSRASVFSVHFPSHV